LSTFLSATATGTYIKHLYPSQLDGRKDMDREAIGLFRNSRIANGNAWFQRSRNDPHHRLPILK
jgi:hypothetical protein